MTPSPEHPRFKRLGYGLVASSSVSKSPACGGAISLCYADRGHGPRRFARAASLVLDRSDLAGAEDAPSQARARMQAMLQDAPGLGKGPLFRHALFRLPGDCWLWFQSYHHIAMDGVGMRGVAARVAGTYTRLRTGR